MINPDNLVLLIDQLRCAAFELPFTIGDSFGHSQFGGDVLDLLLEEGDVKRFGNRLMWSGTGYPSQQVSLRSAGSEQVVIQVGSTGDGAARMIGEVGCHP